ncbi:MAG TPA: HAMP domain-containing sensor histidine kinase [Bacteroidales bacterium]|nr:HAMP domain-containing sensor histidine kinase [Bacteroidales bacterium]
MNLFKNKQYWQILLFIAAVVIGISSLLYTNQLVTKMARQEHLKAAMLANAYTQIVNAEPSDQNLDFFAGVIQDNETIPVIVTDSAQNLIFSRNLDTSRLRNPTYVKKMLGEMKENSEPISITLVPDKQYLYYNESLLLTRLKYYPYIQLGIILLFIFVAYLALRTSRKFEENKVWVGLTRETAHQLGTPISSLLAWMEMMKIRNSDEEMLKELEKDVSRLEKITERFSKIGSKPVMSQQDIRLVIQNAVNYIKSRSSDKIHFSIDLPTAPLDAPLNAALFEWVIENLCKNAIDALQGKGHIKISASNLNQWVQIDVSDTGKGMPKSMFKSVFEPGFTTKKKGWGLGLSLVKRIIEEYHEGRIFVYQSEINKGTVFRILLKKP